MTRFEYSTAHLSLPGIVVPRLGHSFFKSGVLTYANVLLPLRTLSSSLFHKMAFKVPFKRRRVSSVASSSNSRSSSSRQSSLVRSPTPSPLGTQSKHFRLRSRKKAPSQSASNLAAPVPSYRRIDSLSGSQASAVLGDVDFQAEDDLAVHNREDDDTLNEIVMAIDLRSRDTVGCSYYIAREEKLYLMNDIKFGGVEIIETCMYPSASAIKC